MAIPVAIILVCTMPAFIRNAEEILKVLAIMMIFLASIATIGIWSVIANEYSYPDNDRDREFIKGAVLVTGVASAAMIIGATMVDRSHVPTGLAAGFIPAGFIITVSRAVTAALEGNTRPEKKEDSVIRLGQLAAIAGTLICSAGILILCRNQFPL